jgi:two-component system, OmpR family, heavy metal sensor histidine kinase CusS
LVLTKEPHFHYETAGGERWRVGVFATDRHEVIVAASLTAFTANVQKLRGAFAIAVPSAVILIAFGAWLVSGQAIRPIRDIADTAEKVTAAGLSQRIAEPGTGDELHRLTVVLNRMLDRLEDGFKQATRFSADASHELKTPLTIMQGELEAALREAPASSQQQRVYASQLEEVTRLKRIVSSLLLLSRADAGQLNLARERIDVSSNFAAICEDAEILADAADITLTSEVEPGLDIMGDRALLQQVFQNLISNAVKYNRPTGSIICRLRRDDVGGNALFDFENTGDCIPEEDQGKIFRRFHRADAARGRDIDGFGLGLNLALEIARAHSGTLVLIKSDTESTHFRLTIPLA